MSVSQIIINRRTFPKKFANKKETCILSKRQSYVFCLNLMKRDSLRGMLSE